MASANFRLPVRTGDVTPPTERPEAPDAHASRRPGVELASRALSVRASLASRIPEPLWLAVLVGGVAISAVYYLPFMGGVARQWEYLGSEVIAAAVFLASLLIVPPARSLGWALIGAGIICLAIGDFTGPWGTSEQTVSIADAFYLAEYPFLFLGMALVVREKPDRATVLDVIVFSTTAAVVIAELLVRPFLQDGSLSSTELAIDVAYPVADVALLSLVVGLALSAGLRSAAVRLLALGLLITLVADLAYLSLEVVGASMNPAPYDFVYVFSMFVWTAAILHPSAREAPAAVPVDWLRRRTPRLTMLGAALLPVPLVTGLDALTGNLGDLPPIVIAWLFLVLLVWLRMEDILTHAGRSEERFRTMFEGSPAGVGINRGSQILAANEAARQMFGYSSEPAVLATPLTSLVPGSPILDVSDPPTPEKPCTRSFETVGTRADGSHFPVLVQGRPIQLADGPATIRFFLDLTDIRAAEDTLRESERRYRELFEANPNPMLVVDVETLRVLAANDAVEGQYGWSRDEFGRMTLLDIVMSEDVPAVLAHVGHDDSAVGRSGPWVHRHKDGSTARVEITTHNTTWDGRRASLVLVIDVTERLRLEEQLLQAQKMEAVGRLAGGVAHDFNNMLTAITGYGNLLAMSLDVDDERRADVGEILNASDRAATLTRQLLAFARRTVLQERVLDLNETITETLGMLQRLIGEDIVLRTRFAPDVARVKADPGQLLQVLMNLAVNARDAMPSGGTLTIETANVVLTEADARTTPGLRAGSHVMLAVTDTGTGMDAETIRHIFEPFFTTKPAGQGTGLGLATVYGIVKQSGGSIWADSEPGLGATFRINFPAMEQEDLRAAESTGSPGPEPCSNEGETILVVEDEPAVRHLVSTVLRQRGYRVLEAENAASGELEAASFQGRIDLLITDVVMPGLNGEQLAARITKARPDTRVLFMSGYTENAIVHEGVLDEGRAFLEKPFGPEALLLKVHEVLARQT